MISSIAWVPKGVADPNPKKYEMSAVEAELIQSMQRQATIGDNNHDGKIGEDEFDGDEDDRMKTMGLGQVILGGDTQSILEAENGTVMQQDGEEETDGDNNQESGVPKEHQSKSARSEIENAPVQSDDDENDESSEDEDDLEDIPDTREYTPIDIAALESMGLARAGMETDQPLMDDDDESEMEDVRIGPDDALIAVAKTEDDYANLEIHCYDEASGTLFVHHDIALPAFPLCLAHGQVCNDRTGNFCAVGTFDPGIEIWNLDVLNALEPICSLGGQDTSATDEIMKMQVLGTKANMSKFQASDELRHGSHTDAVMCLSWNDIHKQVLASGSADTTVKLWDVTRGNTDQANASTFRHHTGKVQALAWNPAEGTLLASASFDRTVALVDARGDGSNYKSFKSVADCEAIAWDPFAPERLTVITEDGTMACWDVRNLNQALWSKEISAYGGTTDLSYNHHVKGLAVTCSIDKTVSLWDLHGSEPQLCGSKDMCSGKLYTAAFYPSHPWLLGCGGGGNQLALWDLSSEATIQKRFADRLKSDQEDESNVPTPMIDSILDPNEVDQAGTKSQPAKSSLHKQKRKKGATKKKAHKRRH